MFKKKKGRKNLYMKKKKTLSRFLAFLVSIGCSLEKKSNNNNNNKTK